MALADHRLQKVENGVVKLVSVETGLQDGQVIEIVSGLAAGDEVVAKAGAKLNAEEMVGLLKTKIANYKVPKKIYIVDSLPRNAMGKVQKNLLREKYQAA